MNRSLLLLPLLVLVSVTPHAQTPRSKVGFVSTQALVKAVPGNKDFIALQTKVNSDLRAREAAMAQLTTKAQKSRTKADADAVLKARQSYVVAQQDYSKRLDALFKPLKAKIESAVAASAKANGYGLILDTATAKATGTVVYANTASLDLTADVIKRLK